MKKCVIILLFYASVNCLQAKIYYASPSGRGNGNSINSPFRISDFWSVSSPGDTLILLDGKYTGSNSMIDPPSSLRGTNTNRIVIKALNDGKVELDGGGNYDPIDLSNNDYFIIEGINAHNARYRAVVHIHNGSDHNIIRRVCAWDATNSNTEIFGAHGSNQNLFEDCAGWGVARKIFSNSQGGNYTTFRRCYGKWMHHTGGSPKCTFTSSYNSYHALLENCIGTWDEDASFHINEPYGVYRGGRSDGSRQTYERHYGNIAYLLNNYDFQADEMYFWQNQYDIEFKDCISYVEGSRYSDIYSFHIYPHNDNGIVLRNITSIGGAGLRCYGGHDCDVRNHYEASNASQLTANSGNILNPSLNGIKTGATVMKRYVNGELTDEDLWPWPMNQRIIDAMILSGREPVDVTRTVFELGGGTMPNFGNLTGSISTSTTNGPAPLSINFIANARGGTSPYSYSWNFGDGNTSNRQNPSHTYSQIGDYVVRLTVTDHDDNHVTNSVAIHVIDSSSLEATATATPLSGSVPLTVSFTATALGGTFPYSYSWNFGDGMSSRQQNPSHTYTQTGDYTAALAVTDNNGKHETNSVTIHAIDPSNVLSINDIKFTYPGEHQELTQLQPENWYDLYLYFNTSNGWSEIAFADVWINSPSYTEGTIDNRGGVFHASSSYPMSLSIASGRIWPRQTEGSIDGTNVTGTLGLYVDDRNNEYEINSNQGWTKVRIKLLAEAEVGDWFINGYIKSKDGVNSSLFKKDIAVAITQLDTIPPSAPQNVEVNNL